MTRFFALAAAVVLLSAPLAAQRSPHGSVKQACTDCHTTASWKDLASPMKFQHSSTGFLLEGAHASATCIQCHTTKRFTATARDCYSCHQKDFAAAADPNHRTGLFPHQCASCHTLTSWKPSVFEHVKTNFPLTGAHRSVECRSCHVNDRYKGLSADCFSCHQTDYRNTTSPDHAASGFPRDCMTCHTNTAWTPSTFDHAKTDFPLTGAHAGEACSACHAGGKFSGRPTDCYSCHRNDYTATVRPNHAAASFDRQCTTCHTTSQWNPSTFDHAKTEFQLTGAHRTADCSGCHAGGVFKGTPRLCLPCHQTDMNRAVMPNHVKGKFSAECMTCHTTVAWKPSSFDHAKTQFALLGAHTAVSCSQCHATDRYDGLPGDCISCHQKEYAEASSPDHLTAQFSRDCQSCHSLSAWKPSLFDHARTAFPLVGAHASASCAVCHTGGRFTGMASDCHSCHRAEYAAVTVPNHAAAQFPTACLTCHTQASWRPAAFDHSKGGFPLIGAHAAATCGSCHGSGTFAGTASDCFSCHQNGFTSVASPNHVTGQFSHLCLTCHTQTAWKPSTFSHAATSFPLTGAHIAVPCVQCHQSGPYAGTSKDCFSCHQQDFAGVTDPNHTAGNFDHNCTSCHTTTAWSPASFDHSKTSFPLAGAHATTACSACHSGGVFAGTSPDCYGCHTGDYTSAANPAHATANYPTTCNTCHGTTAWKPSTFNHTPFFPIRSGDTHRPGRWATCSDCHTNTSNPKVFSCLTCHEHNKTSMDSKHQGRSGYSYDSNACYRCHPDGKE